MRLYYWGIESYGYTPTTTCWRDFTIAERYDFHTIIKTYKNIHHRWRMNLHELTELSMVLLAKASCYLGTANDRLYTKLYKINERYLLKYLTNEEAVYYWEKMAMATKQCIDDNKFMQLYFRLNNDARTGLLEIENEISYRDINQNSIVEYLQLEYLKTKEQDVYKLTHKDMHRLNTLLARLTYPCKNAIVNDILIMNEAI